MAIEGIAVPYPCRFAVGSQQRGWPSELTSFFLSQGSGSVSEA